MRNVDISVNGVWLITTWPEATPIPTYYLVTIWTNWLGLKSWFFSNYVQLEIYFVKTKVVLIFSFFPHFYSCLLFLYKPCRRTIVPMSRMRPFVPWHSVPASSPEASTRYSRRRQAQAHVSHLSSHLFLRVGASATLAHSHRRAPVCVQDVRGTVHSAAASPGARSYAPRLEGV